MFAQSGTDAIARGLRGFIGAEAHDALDLRCTDTFLAGQHHVNDPEPIPQRLIRVLEDRPDQNREPIAASFGAFRTLPVEGPVSHGINVNIPAARAMDTFLPTALNE